MKTVTSWATRDTPRHTVSEVARYTGIPPATVRHWLRFVGHVAPFRASHLDLMELVVVGAWMREWPERDRRTAIRYAKSHHDYLAKKSGIRHPFAIERAFAGKGCAFDGNAVKTVAGFDYSDGLAVRWYPRGRANPVVIDARRGFGSPTVGGVNTWVLAGRARAGESVELIADDYALTAEQVRAVLEFEGVEEVKS